MNCFTAVNDSILDFVPFSETMIEEGEKMTKLRKGDLVDKAYSRLKKKIITLEIKPGASLDEKMLMEELGIGRTPLRQAILLLKNEHFVGGQPNKSCYVKEFSLDEARELFETLTVLEKNINHLAAIRITVDELKEIRRAHDNIERAIQDREFWEITAHNFKFHQIIARASRNRFLSRMHEEIRMQSERLSYISVSREIEDNVSLCEHYKRISQQHSKIIKCLDNHDHKGIEKVSVEHVNSFQRRIVNSLMRISYV